MRRRVALFAVMLALMALGAEEKGCNINLPPNPPSVTDDGGRMIFSLTPDATFEADEKADLYALDIEKGRLEALTSGPAGAGWHTWLPGGRGIVYTRLPLGKDDGMGLRMIYQLGKDVALTGVTEDLGYPVVVPGDPPCLLAFVMTGERGEIMCRLLVMDDKPRAVPMEIPAGKVFMPMWPMVGATENRFAIITVVQDKDAPEDAPRGECFLYVADIERRKVRRDEGKAKAKPEQEAQEETISVRFTKAASWRTARTAEKGQDLIPMFPTFSPDGKRLVVLLFKEHGEDEGLKAFEIDPSGKQPPKLLLTEKDKMCLDPRWTPDGKGLVYIT